MTEKRKRTSVFIFLSLLFLLSFAALFSVPSKAYEGIESYACETLSPGEKELYDALAETVKEFEMEKKDARESRDYEIAAVSYEKFGVDAYGAIRVWKIFFVENPGCFWLENRVLIRNTRLRLFCYPAYAQYSLRSQARTRIQKEAQRILTQAEGVKGQKNIARVLHDALIAQAGYAYTPDGTSPSDMFWAHNIEGALTGKGAVCDGFSKAYAYLLQKKGITCLFVDGKAGPEGEKHAWNAARLDDQWFWIDVTWDGQLDEDRCYTYFGMADGPFREKHTPYLPEGTGAESLYPLPEISKTGLPVIRIYENGILKSIVTDTAEALLSADQPGAAYRFVFFDDGKGEREYLFPAGTLPEVGSLCFSGASELFMPALTLLGDLSVACPLILENVILLPATDDAEQFHYIRLQMNGYPLTFSGTDVFAEAGTDPSGKRISALSVEDPGCVVTVTAAGSVEWDGQLQIGTLILSGGHMQLGPGENRVEELVFTSELATLHLSDREEESQHFSVGEIRGTGMGTVLLGASRGGDSLEICHISGTQGVSLTVCMLGQETLPTVSILNKTESPIEYTLKMYQTDVEFDGTAGTSRQYTEYADLTGYDGKLAFAPEISPDRIVLFFALPDRTVPGKTVSVGDGNLYCDSESLAEIDRCLRGETGVTPTPEPVIYEDHTHLFEEWRTMLEPNCYREGIRVRCCCLCKLTEYEFIPMTVHHFGGWHWVTERSDSREGREIRYCEICGSCQIRITEPPNRKESATPSDSPKPTRRNTATPKPTGSPSASKAEEHLPMIEKSRIWKRYFENRRDPHSPGADREWIFCGTVLLGAAGLLVILKVGKRLQARKKRYK